MRSFFNEIAVYAADAVITDSGGERNIKAFVEPVSITNPEEKGMITPAGVRDDRRYLLITSADAVTEEGSTVSCGGENYEILRWEVIGGASHTEALMKRKAEVSHA